MLSILKPSIFQSTYFCFCHLVLKASVSYMLACSVTELSTLSSFTFQSYLAQLIFRKCPFPRGWSCQSHTGPGIPTTILFPLPCWGFFLDFLASSSSFLQVLHPSLPSWLIPVPDPATLFPRVTSWVCAQSLSCVWLFGIPQTVAHQAPLSKGFSRQEYWRG